MATTEKDALWPAGTVWFWGWDAIAGAAGRETELEEPPQAPARRQSKTRMITPQAVIVRDLT